MADAQVAQQQSLDLLRALDGQRVIEAVDTVRGVHSQYLEQHTAEGPDVALRRAVCSALFPSKRGRLRGMMGRPLEVILGVVRQIKHIAIGHVDKEVVHRDVAVRDALKMQIGHKLGDLKQRIADRLHLTEVAAPVNVAAIWFHRAVAIIDLRFAQR